MSSALPIPAAPRRPASRLPAMLLVPLLLLPLLHVGAGPAAAGDDDRDLEPIPRMLIYDTPEKDGLDPETWHEMRETMKNSFASLGNVERARDLLVHRYGVVCVPEVLDILRVSRNQAEVWNASLTIAALRDVEGPALQLKAPLRILTRILDDENRDGHDAAMAALALGCFHWPESVVPERLKDRGDSYEAVPGPALTVERAARALQDARKVLVQRATDKLVFVRVAATLALAKMGGEAAGAELFALDLAKFTNFAPHQALLLARGFLDNRDVKPLRQGLTHHERQIRAAAALAMAVAMLQESPAKWCADDIEVLRDLRGRQGQIKMDKEDGAEAVFARGVCAWRNQANDEWKKLWKLATLPSSKEAVAQSAAQMLLFCDLPWFREEILKWAASQRVALPGPVLSMIFLRAARTGAPEALDALIRWLNSASVRPKPDEKWDPRWYIVIGLMDALAAGRIKPKADRKRTIDALRKAAHTVLSKRAPIQEALQAVLDTHGERLAAAEESALYRLPRSELRRLEDSVTCPCGLLAKDPLDVCARRVNEMVWRIFGLHALPPNKPGETKYQPQRHLKRYLARFPYFSRLEFRIERGARPYPLLGTDAKGIDR